MAFRWTDEPDSPLQPGAVVISCFPSAGLATTVAALYMIRILKLPRIGRFEAPDMMPIAVVQGGQVHPPIRVYGRKDFAVVVSEFPPTPSQATALASAIMEGATERKARWILGLEGVIPHPEGETDEDTEPPEETVWAAISRPDAGVLRAFAPSGVLPLEEGIIGGVSGSLLVQGIGGPLPVAVLLVSARAGEGYPDHRAGATLIEAVDRILPEIHIDTGPLRAQAEGIEKALRAAMKGHAGPGEAGAKPPISPEMYR
ncbi:MAG: proteasome assembly chaperone family protein [Thermoplasmata archaeon]|nr:proteasome assembly chaperone family protein [Thermoplasmata archaeon]